MPLSLADLMGSGTSTLAAGVNSPFFNFCTASITVPLFPK
jgi:hypothetical protein